MDLLPYLVTTGVGLVVGVAVNRNSIRSLNRRVAELENWRQNLAHDFLPRPEAELALKNIERNVEQTNRLVRDIVFHGGGRGSIAAIEAAAQHFVYDHAGLLLTESMEGCRLTAYWDTFANVWTIGYGHTAPDVHEGLVITQAQAEILLASDIAAAAACVNTAVTYPISQPQFDACTDFAFNAGRGHFLGSTLLLCINQGRLVDAQAEFLKWVNAGGRRVAGLVRRRTAEAAMFHTDPQENKAA